MELHQYQRYKRRSPLWIIAGIVILAVAVFVMIKKLHDFRSPIVTSSTINLNISLKDSDSVALPLVFLLNREVIYYHTNSLRKDTLLKVNIATDTNIVEVLDNYKRVIVSGKWKSHSNDSIFVEFRIGEDSHKPEIIIGNKLD